MSFEGVSSTTVILAPGACRKGALSSTCCVGNAANVDKCSCVPRVPRGSILSAGCSDTAHLLGIGRPIFDKIQNFAQSTHRKAKGAPKHSQRDSKASQREPKTLQRHPRAAKGTRYISKISRSTAQAAVMLLSQTQTVSH